jgi:adenylate cyclase, class 2
MGQETEAKFYVKDLQSIEARLLSLGARMIQPRTHELNLRFDTANRDFQREHRVLRLRQDEAALLTYKDGTKLMDGAFSRREIEFTVSDFDSAKQFLEALGYEVVFTYEKYRTTYILPLSPTEVESSNPDVRMQIMLDELPIGDFVEIEGELDQLKPAAHYIGLKWETAIPASYHELFDHAWTSRKLNFRDLTYENFKDIQISPSDINVLPADA